MNVPKFTKAYLGDSVYAEVENGMIKLTTENGFGATNTIYLEPEVFEALCDYVAAAYAYFAALAKAAP